MYFISLKLKNFKGFERFECAFPPAPGVAVLIGENGSGKTAILDALAVSAGSLFLALSGGRQRPIHPGEIRRAKVQHGQTVNMEPQTPVQVTCKATLSGKELKWTREKLDTEGRTSRRRAKSIIDVSRTFAEEVKTGHEIILPLIAYFGTGRLWLQKKEREIPASRLASRLRGYVDCLDPASSPKLLFQWWKEKEWEEYQRRERLSTLAAVKEAVQSCLEGDGAEHAKVHDVRYDARQREITAFFADGHELLFSQLSDGYRNILGMVADLAYRAAVLNPHLEAEAARQTPGVVFVDEIDLHLHPRWQRHVLADLRRAFPLVQFIVTTHSPFIIQSTRPDEVVNLDREHPLDKVQRSIEDIAEHDMGVEMPQRSARYLKMMDAARDYYRVLQQAKSADPAQLALLKARLDELSAPFSDNPAYHAFLEMERARTQIDEKSDAPG